jgi:CHASE2 domain-containing sensor protein
MYVLLHSNIATPPIAFIYLFNDYMCIDMLNTIVQEVIVSDTVIVAVEAVVGGCLGIMAIILVMVIRKRRHKVFVAASAAFSVGIILWGYLICCDQSQLPVCPYCTHCVELCHHSLMAAISVIFFTSPTSAFCILRPIGLSLSFVGMFG